MAVRSDGSSWRESLALSSSGRGGGVPEQPSLPGFGATPPPTHVLFFALFPDVATAARITQLVQKLRGEHGLQSKPLVADRFHISLFGLGAYPRLPPDMVARAREAAAAVAAAPFDVAFDRVVSFRSGPANQPLVLLGSGDNAALTTFHRALGSALTKAGIGLQSPSRFTPHVTLMYAERGIDEQAVAAIGWTVREFVLVDSLLGQTRHVPLGRWPLRG